MTLRRLFAALLLLAVLTTGAMAHAGLISTDPVEGTSLDAAPAFAAFTFTEAVTPLRFSLTGSDGITVGLTVASQDGGALSVSLPPELARGSYLLSWRVTSEDGHPVNGVVSFAIRQPDTVNPTVPASPLAPLIWAVRTLQCVALFLGLGSIAFVAIVARAAPAPQLGARWLVVLGLILVPMAIGLEGLDLLGLPLSGVLTLEPWQQSFGSTYGATQIVLALAFVMVLLPWRAAVAIAAIAGAIAPALSGHASSADPQPLLRLAVAVHMASLLLWLGALWPLLSALRHNGLAGLRAFSRLIPSGIALLLLSGIGLAVVQLGPPGPAWASPYALLLAVKLGLVALLLGLALWNRLSLTPRALGGDARLLRRSIAIEIVLAVAVLAVVAGWRFTPPPRVLNEVAAAAVPLSVELAGGPPAGTLTVAPGHAGPVELTLALSMPADGVEVLLTNPAHDIATLSRTAIRRDDLHWVVADLVLPVAGEWNAVVKVRLSRFDLATLTANIPLTSNSEKDPQMIPHRLAAAAALAALLSSGPALSEDVSAPQPAMTQSAVVTLGDLEISDAFTRATLPNAPVGAGYLTITNKGTIDDRLVAVSSPAAGIAQIHEMKMEGDVMKMGELPDGLVIAAGQAVTLSPGGLHIMFMDLKQSFTEGSSIPVTLTFEQAGTVDVQLPVGAINADAPAGDIAGMGM